MVYGWLHYLFRPHENVKVSSQRWHLYFSFTSLSSLPGSPSTTFKLGFIQGCSNKEVDEWEKCGLKEKAYLISFDPFVIFIKLILPSDNVHQAEGDPGVQHAGHVDHPLLRVATMRRRNGREG